MTAFSRPSSSTTTCDRRAILLVAALLPSVVEAGWWSITGPCRTSPSDSSCIQSPGYPYNNYGNSQDCTMRWHSSRRGWYLSVVSFNTESCCDKLTVNGHDYSGNSNSLVSARPSLRGDVRWHTDRTVTRSGWKLCARQRQHTTPSTTWSVTGPCRVVSGERECVTSPYWPSNYGNSQTCRMRITNGRSMYLQSASFYTESNFDHLDWNGRRYSGGGGSISWSNSALWSSVSWTTDRTVQKKGWKICARERNDVYWNVAGPCTAVAGQPHCVTSPHYPFNYDHNEACTMNVPNHGGLYLHTIAFNTESSFDRLTVNGHRYSGSGSGLVGRAVYFSGDVSWTSDGSNARSGWKICASRYSSRISSNDMENETEVNATEENEEPASNKTADAPMAEIEGLAELLAAGASGEDEELMAKLKRTTAKSEMMEEEGVEMEEEAKEAEMETKMDEEEEEEETKETEMETEMEETETEEASSSESEVDATSTMTTTQTMLV